MLPRPAALTLAALLVTPVAAAQVSAVPASITLDDAVRLAFQRSPELHARRAEADEARARALTARTLPFNPGIALSDGRRRGAGRSSSDRGIAISQEIEIGGQRARRKAASADGRRVRELLGSPPTPRAALERGSSQNL